jgi:flavin reductase (DIM6/NTAB) family NADH-FMN oxidoreductase RutF
MNIHFSNLTPESCYALMTQAIIPRPIAWVLTENEDKKNYNLAPFSYFNAVCSNPPAIMVSISSNPEQTKKDTSKNLVGIDTPFVVHIAPIQEIHNLNNSAASFSYGESEIEKLNLPLVEWDFPIPRLREAPLAFACKIWKVIELGDNGLQSLLLAKIQSLYVKDEIASKDQKGRTKINAHKINPLIRLGFGEYASLGEIFTIQRPK